MGSNANCATIQPTYTPQDPGCTGRQRRLAASWPWRRNGYGNSTLAKRTQRELAPLAAQQATLAGRVAALQAAVAEAQGLHADRQRSADELRSEVGQRQQARQALVKSLDTARGVAAPPAGPQADAASRLAQMDERHTTLQAELAQHSAAPGKAHEAAAAEEALHAAEAQAGQVDERVSGILAEIAAVDQQVEALRGELRQAEEIRRAADRALDRLHTRQGC